MLRKLVPEEDNILDRPPFMNAEVQYNLMHQICCDAGAFCLKSADGNMIFAQTPGHRAWLWICDSVQDSEKNRDDLALKK